MSSQEAKGVALIVFMSLLGFALGGYMNHESALLAVGVVFGLLASVPAVLISMIGDRR